ncbi:hypothetical protein ACS5PU_16405 [Pedobacter sp. GSP4]|uniref:hypothetical protein n=1 Tax=Pedobacter sp. GSP4 TaxID=3453716 RepID=UPI003EE9D06A
MKKGFMAYWMLLQVFLKLVFSLICFSAHLRWSKSILGGGNTALKENQTRINQGKSKEDHNQLVLSYLTLRKLIGIAGMALPFLLAVAPSRASEYLFDLEPSISDYFFTSRGDVLVVVLCLIGFFLLVYNRYNLVERYYFDPFGRCLCNGCNLCPYWYGGIFAYASGKLAASSFCFGVFFLWVLSLRLFYQRWARDDSLAEVG